MSAHVEIVEIAAADTHDLRRRVLRDGTPSDAVAWDGDEDLTTFHLGATADGELVAISTWLRNRYPDRPAEEGYQLRGMATEPAQRGTRVSSALLVAGLERCALLRADLVWARARVPALSFYERHGFEVVGPEYVDLTTGLPHRDIVRSLRAAT